MPSGDIRDEKKVLAWFTDQGNLELANQIEEVNEKMLKKIIASSPHIVAFFCKFLSIHKCWYLTCRLCSDQSKGELTVRAFSIWTDEEKNKEALAILKELENIDDECDELNVDFVKISDPGVASTFKLSHVPALVYFRRTASIPYTGDLMDEDAVLRWVTSTKEQDVDIIEEVDAKTLEQMLDEHGSVVVYFCKF